MLLRVWYKRKELVRVKIMIITCLVNYVTKFLHLRQVRANPVYAVDVQTYRERKLTTIIQRDSRIPIPMQ